MCGVDGHERRATVTADPPPPLNLAKQNRNVAEHLNNLITVLGHVLLTCGHAHGRSAVCVVKSFLFQVFGGFGLLGLVPWGCMWEMPP